MHSSVIAFANAALTDGVAVALAVLTESGRDTPGVPGGMIAVCADGSRRGTVGGGRLEAEIIQDCLSALASADAVRSFDHSLRPDGTLGMVCGGEVRGFVTVLRPEKRLVIFGGGHVGRKVCEAGLVAGFGVTVVTETAATVAAAGEEEERQEKGTERKPAPAFPGAAVVAADDFRQATRDLALTPDTYVVVATRGHAQDHAVLSEIIGRGCAYIGLIGSSSKAAGIRRMLLAEGAPAEAVERIFTPVGVDIDDGTPGEIAIGIMAEILSVKNDRAVLRHRRDRGKEKGAND